MHYYKFNIPDWALHTAHLSLVEEAVYRRLIDHYYDTESPIPKETHSVFRRLRLSADSDTAAMILAEFFTLTDDGWRHKRCDEVIAEYHRKSGANQENGKKGGRPRKDALTDNPEETHSVISGNPSETLTTNQELLTTNQDNKPPTSAAKAADPVPHMEIVGLYNEILASQGLTAVKPNLWPNSTRATHLKARWREDAIRQSVDWWRGFFEYVAQSDFLMGRTRGDRPWQADLGWMLEKANFIKICEGKYHV